MNGSFAQISELVNLLNSGNLPKEVGTDDPKAETKLIHSNSCILLSCARLETVVSPPFCYLCCVKKAVSPNIAVAAQNCYVVPKGAFTGEIRYLRTVANSGEVGFIVDWIANTWTSSPSGNSSILVPR